MAIRMVAFDEIDWDAFSGSERGPDGTPPHMSSTDFDIVVDSEPVIVVVDAKGIDIQAASGSPFGVRAVLALENIHLALHIASNLRLNMLSEYLETLGFTLSQLQDG